MTCAITWCSAIASASNVVDSGVICKSAGHVADHEGEDEEVDSLLELLGLTHIAKTQVSVLPLGLARLVEVGRPWPPIPKWCCSMNRCRDSTFWPPTT